MDISIIISILSAIVGSTSVFTTLYTTISDRLIQTRKLRKLEEQSFDSILGSSDIIVLGTYLDKEIGLLTISDYVENKNINRKIDVLINKLTQFVGTEEQIQKEKDEQIDQISFDDKMKVIYQGKLGDDFDKVIFELDHGEPWNALARLRRIIEIKLKQLADINNIPVKNIISLTQLMDILKQYGVLELDIINNLKFPINISNRAIHGQDLNRGEAQEAIFHAAHALERIIEKLK